MGDAADDAEEAAWREFEEMTLAEQEAALAGRPYEGEDIDPDEIL